MKNRMILVTMCVLAMSMLFMSCEDPVTPDPVSTILEANTSPITATAVSVSAGKASIPNGAVLVGTNYSSPTTPIAITFDASDNTPQKQSRAIEMSFREAFKNESVPQGLGIGAAIYKQKTRTTASVEISLYPDNIYATSFYDESEEKVIEIQLTGDFIQIINTYDEEWVTTSKIDNNNAYFPIVIEKGVTITDYGTIPVYIYSLSVSQSKLQFRRSLAEALTSALTPIIEGLDTISEDDVEYVSGRAKSATVKVTLTAKEGYAFDKDGATTSLPLQFTISNSTEGNIQIGDLI